jgi:23S rRNA (cytosine1962-C5)-methyltransferase
MTLDLIQRVQKRFRHLNKQFSKSQTNAFRVYDRDIPNFPITADFYDGNLLIYFYQNSKFSDESKTDFLESVKKELLLWLHSSGYQEGKIFIKERKIIDRHKDQYEKISMSKHTIKVLEHGIPFYVNLTDYLDTGLFLDHRLTRQLIREMPNKNRFLNLFSYTSTATVAAALGGAIETVSVDMSNTYAEWSRENFELNQLNLRNHHIVRENVLVYLEEAKLVKANFDFIFVDPPSFSNSKKMTSHFDVQADHVSLLEQCKSLLAPTGRILFSNNLRNFKLDKHLENLFKITNISTKTIPVDFRNQKIHQAYLLEPV